jgi:hypothetical protein
MSSKTKPAAKPTSKAYDAQDLGSDLSLGQISTDRQEFFVAVGMMSWQLAIVVLVPIVGGFKLDGLLGSSPACTVVGFVLAMIGMSLVVWRQLVKFSPPALPVKPQKVHHS